MSGFRAPAKRYHKVVISAKKIILNQLFHARSGHKSDALAQTKHQAVLQWLVFHRS